MIIMYYGMVYQTETHEQTNVSLNHYKLMLCYVVWANNVCFSTIYSNPPSLDIVLLILVFY